MSVHVIEITDADLRVVSAGELISHGPGYAVIDDAKVAVGEVAFNQARIHPRRSHNQFWYRLSLDPLTQANSHYRHHADLVYAHLKAITEQLGESPQVIFAVPGSYSNEQLSLLLGIAKECSIKVVGLVDIAVAAAAVSTLQPLIYHLDIHLHQLVITELRVAEQVQRGTVVTTSDVGLVKFNDYWVQLIADTFIEQCRFDPLHNAQSEQALYCQLPQWLAAFAETEEVLLEMTGSANRFQARLLKSQVVEKVQPLYRKLLQALHEVGGVTDSLSLLVSPRLAQLPGFCGLLNSYQVVSDMACYQGCENNLSFICRDQAALSFVTALPLPDGQLYQPEPVADQLTADTQRATHIVYGDKAFKLSDKLYVGASGPDGSLILNTDNAELYAIYCEFVLEQSQLLLKRQSDVSIRVNGATLSSNAVLKPGDELIVGDGHQRLLVVRES